MFIFGCGNKCDSGRPSLRGGGGDKREPVEFLGERTSWRTCKFQAKYYNYQDNGAFSSIIPIVCHKIVITSLTYY